MKKVIIILSVFFALILVFLVVRYMPEQGMPDLIGGQKDEYGCLTAAGYRYCPSTKQCQRMWEEYCEEYKDEYRGTSTEINNFYDCAAAGNPVMESYPRQCRANGQLFVEDVHGPEAKKDLIVLEEPLPESDVKSPLTVKGKARGNWFFEAAFPVFLTDWDGRIIAETYASAKEDWMTEDFVPFEAVVEFTADTSVSSRGALILKKANPSGLPENDDALEITVFLNE